MYICDLFFVFVFIFITITRIFISNVFFQLNLSVANFFMNWTSNVA